ncbi:MAG TPA: glycosyltransferase family 4 protein, partial [Actinomycetota bacterium]|nr:glycosyltransferase family 4 protein [Actinomycetota bacterium]
EIAAHLRRADVVVRPTLTEGMSLTVLEAMASGACVVASNVPGNAELIAHGVNGLLAPAGDRAAFAAQLRRAVDDPRERRRLGERAAEDSLAYSWDRCAEETLAVFEEAARRGADRRRASA